MPNTPESKTASSKPALRKALAFTAVFSLAIAGILAGSSAANAAPGGNGTFNVTEAAATPSTFDVSYTGTAPAGDVIGLESSDGQGIAEATATGGTFTISSGTFFDASRAC